MNYLTPKNLINLTEMQECLYAYTGPPPMAYGTQTAYVLENIGRPYKYYYDSNNPPTRVKTGTKNINRITLDKPSSGFNLEWLQHLLNQFCDRNQSALNLSKEEIHKTIYYMPYSELSKGRQTWSFISQTNIPAASALEETVRFLERNLGRKLGRSMLSYNQAVIDLFDKPNVQIEKKFRYPIRVYDTFGDESEAMYREEIRVETISREELWTRACTLNTMLKSAERGRLKRRSIATASMLLRGFVKVIEETAKILLLKIDSSGIPVGGEEKLAKLCSKLTLSNQPFTGELSGDEEKWNECLDPDAMRVMWTGILERMNQPHWVLEYFNIPFLMFKNKVALMGPGLTYIAKGSKVTKKFPLGYHKSEFDYLIPLKVDDDRIKCTLGMFMGMFNFSSTLLGLLATDNEYIKGTHVQSSDDFIHFTGGESTEEVLDQVEMLRVLGKMVGVNMSADKSLLITPAGIGEFTSKYHVDEFVGNVATELPAITPAGLNPMSDLAMGLQTIKNSLLTFQMLHPTADLALRIFLKSYRHAYMVEGVTRRTQFLDLYKIPRLVLYQGAPNIYSISTLHLEEISFRRYLNLLTDEDLQKILNPSNPITGGDRVITIRTESKMPVSETDISLGSIFKFQWARNRTVLNTPYQANLEKEKEYQEIAGFIESCFPEVLVGSSNIRGELVESTQQRLEALISTDSELTPEQKTELLNELLSD